MGSPQIHEVWAYNYLQELCHMEEIIGSNKILVMDCEFPGCLFHTDVKADAFTRYYNLKKNIDATKLLQLGLTVLSDEGSVVGCWEINFSFDVASDAHNESSIAFLESHGFDFENLKKFGVQLSDFSTAFRRILGRRTDWLWITFHGLYDFGYLMRLLTGQVLPDSDAGFADTAGYVFGSVVDLKFVSTFFDALYHGKLGLERLARIVGVERVGEAHQAGSDSLLTALVYVRMKLVYRVDQSMFRGHLFGLGEQIVRRRRISSPLVVPCNCPFHFGQPEFSFSNPCDRPFQVGHFSCIGPAYHYAYA